MVLIGLVAAQRAASLGRGGMSSRSWLRPLVERAQRGDDTAPWDGALTAHPEALSNLDDAPVPNRIAAAAELLRSEGYVVRFSVEVNEKDQLVNVLGIGTAEPLPKAVFDKVAPLLTTASAVLCDPAPKRTLPPGTAKPYGRMRADGTFWSYDPHRAEAAGALE
ncbi:hypothetical protein [Amycolatopsis australiensis]|uniref:hypothetical protein n=1 Tax=Amycolatopsis australiensis TaxID=546364 RepID=UPI00116133C7|nr:hypothetical protein [Amycolatopsis australiensis]